MSQAFQRLGDTPRDAELRIREGSVEVESEVHGRIGPVFESPVMIARKDHLGHAIAIDCLRPAAVIEAEFEMKHYLLFYETADDYVARRAQFRSEHLAKAWQASQRGELLLGGALADPIDGAVLLFRCDSPSVVEKFASADPYVTGGLVKHWQVREWMTVVGDQASAPARADALT
jgi:uncharacterized protein